MAIRGLRVEPFLLRVAAFVVKRRIPAEVLPWRPLAPDLRNAEDGLAEGEDSEEDAEFDPVGAANSDEESD